MNNGSLARSRTSFVPDEGRSNDATGSRPIAAKDLGPAPVASAPAPVIEATLTAAEPKPAPVVAQPKSKRGRMIMAVLAAVVAIGFGYHIAARWYIESTDDAQVDAELVGVAARSGGTVRKVYFTDNQVVHEGQLLAELDDSPARAKLAQADANLAAA